MIFRQLFDSVSSTYTYLLASRRGGEALIIDPVLEKVDRYVQLLQDLDLRLIKAVDTHVHADHITGLGALRDKTHCITVMGEQSGVDVVSMRVADGDKIDIEGLSLDVLYTPGHTDDSYSFILPDRVFTGYTLLIRGTGRTDFQNGDPRAQYESIFGRLLKLPDSVRAMLQSGTLSAGHARTLVTAANPEQLAQRIVKEGLSVRQSEALSQQLLNPKPAKEKSAKAESKDRLLANLPQQLKHCRLFGRIRRSRLAHLPP